MPVIKGTKDSKVQKAQRVKKTTGGTNKVRCPHCASLATAVPDGRGKYKHKCTGCGVEYRFRSL